MKMFPADYLRSFGADLFIACGSPPEEAAIVANDLVESNLMGYDSHGLVRCVEYLRCVRSGMVKPGGKIRVTRETPCTAVVDCGLNFGQVSARAMADVVCRKAAQSGLAAAVSKNCFHVGRLGACVQAVAERNLVAFCACNLRKAGHVVVPWGGREGRLGTNPMAFAAPTRGRPVVVDMSTCMIPEGKVHIAQFEGKPVPPGCIQDADGNPTTDPELFYRPGGGIRGTILPFGAPLFGHKGFGLSLMVEILGGILGGEDSTEQQPGANGVCLIAVNPDHFGGAERFKELTDRFCAYVASSAPAPGYAEVVIPGTFEFRLRDKRLAEGVPIDDRVWDLLVEAAASVGVTPAATCA